MTVQRIIGTYTENRPGPLLICVAGLHGNEWAGVEALSLLIKMLEVEPITNPDFRFYGSLVFLSGNLPALKARTRFIDLDMNRIWKSNPAPSIRESVEHRQMVQLRRLIDGEIRSWHNNQITILDLHTTTAEGGIFCLPTSDRESIRLGREMHAPVITGLVSRLEGTLIRYFTDRYEERGLNGVVFEGGQHDDPLSVNRCIAAVINCMRTIGCVSADHVVNRHDELLVTYARGLPKVAAFRYVHRIKRDDAFRMLPGFHNFQAVTEGTIIAQDKNGPISMPFDGLILMPLYQDKGEDGFFIVEELREQVLNGEG